MNRVLITGASGMVGSIVLRHCLASDQVGEVVSLVRRRGELQHPKLREVVHKDFADFSSAAEAFSGIHAAFFCVGAYTGALPDPEFRRITVDAAVSFADQLHEGSPDAALSFLSGQGADRGEKSRISFARYKGMAENHLLRCGFEHLYIFRPAYIYPVEKRKEPNLGYRISRSLYPMIRLLGTGMSLTSEQLGLAMFRAAMDKLPSNTFENRDILDLVRTE